MSLLKNQLSDLLQIRVFLQVFSGLQTINTYLESVSQEHTKMQGNKSVIIKVVYSITPLLVAEDHATATAVLAIR